MSPPEVKLKKHLRPLLQGGVAATVLGNWSCWGRADGSKDGFAERQVGLCHLKTLPYAQERGFGID